MVPGAGLLYAMPSTMHPFGTAMVLGHGAVLAAELGALAWATRRLGWPVAAAATVGIALVVAGCVAAPSVIVLAGHVAGFVGVLFACGWAVAIRVVGRADTVTLAAIIVVSAVVGAALTAVHGEMPGPLTWIPWAALATAFGAAGVLGARSHLQGRRAGRLAAERCEYLGQAASGVTASVVALQTPAGVPPVTEASHEQIALLRYLVSLAAQPVDDWVFFDDEGAGPLQQYRYQVNAIGWALATYHYSHAPSFAGILTSAQLNLFERAQQKAVWGYWYWTNLLGNWDFIKRRADPIDVPQNTMFTGYLNLQLAMFRQATGDPRFDRPESIVFDWSPKQRYAFDHPTINAIAIRNFDQDLCLWPCEPIPSTGRRRGLVFPYCNAVTTAGIAMMDAINGTSASPRIAAKVEEMLEREFTSGANDLAAFMVSGLGVSVRSFFSGPVTTAAVAAYLAPLCPDLAWRAWTVLEREWLRSGDYRVPNSAGRQAPDWSTNARTNTEAFAAAMLLANALGEREWHDKLRGAAVDQLGFVEHEESPGVRRFLDASVHGNAMLGFGSLGRPYDFVDMLTRTRPQQWQDGPRLKDAPHPAVLVAKAETDGRALDLVLYPGSDNRMVALQLDRLTPGQHYVAHGAVDPDVTADASGAATLNVNITGRTTIELRPA